MDAARHLAVLALFVFSIACDDHPSERTDAGAPDSGAVDAGDGEPRDAGRPPGYECSVTTQDCAEGESCLLFQDDAGTFGARCFGGCSVTGQDCDAGLKCAYALDGGTASRECVPAGDAGEGEPCTTTVVSDTCGAGLICVPDEVADGGAATVCMRYCNSNQDCTAPQACFVVVLPEQNPERPYICETPCSLFGADCPPGLSCYPGSVAPGCYPTGATAVEQPCTYSLECVAGTACVDGFCRQLCAHPSGTPACPSGTCTGLEVPGVGGVGACL